MAKRSWSVAEAKAKLSEVLHAAESAPQLIESRGKEVAVVIGIDDYRKLAEMRDRAAPHNRLLEFLRFSEQVGREGGGDLAVPRRERRRSPFSDRSKY